MDPNVYASQLSSFVLPHESAGFFLPISSHTHTHSRNWASLQQCQKFSGFLEVPRHITPANNGYSIEFPFFFVKEAVRYKLLRLRLSRPCPFAFSRSFIYFLPLIDSWWVSLDNVADKNLSFNSFLRIIAAFIDMFSFSANHFEVGAHLLSKGTRAAGRYFNGSVSTYPWLYILFYVMCFVFFLI